MEHRITGVVLAAGSGTRFGGQKLLFPYRGEPLLSWSLRVVEPLPLAGRLIVLGADSQAILEQVFKSSAGEALQTRGELKLTHNGKEWLALYNPDWPVGMGTSLRRAAQVASGGLLVFLGDMPWVPVAAAQAVLTRAGARPIAPSYQGQRGFPVYLPPTLRPRLLSLAGDRGAREILAGDCDLIPWADPGVVFDVDEDADLARLIGGRA